MKRQRELKSELLSKKAELLQTSAQDQFAKWAKLRRSVDKGLADLEKLSCVPCYCASSVPTLSSLTHTIDSGLSASKSSFALKFGTILWILTTGLQFAIGWWFSRSAVFYLPVAWLGPFTWWLSLPFAPAGESCHSDVVALSDFRRVRFRELRRLADSLSTCHQSGRARGERIYKSASLLFDTSCH